MLGQRTLTLSLHQTLIILNAIEAQAANLKRIRSREGGLERRFPTAADIRASIWAIERQLAELGAIKAQLLPPRTRRGVAEVLAAESDVRPMAESIARIEAVLEAVG